MGEVSTPKDERRPSETDADADAEDAMTVALPGAGDLSDAGGSASQAPRQHAPPPSPSPRRGVLPPPSSAGKRVHPVAASPRARPPSNERAPSATGLPAGLRAPGIPSETKPDDTDVLIASAVAALTDDRTAPAEASSSAFPVPSDAPAPDASTVGLPSSERGGNGRGLWIALAAAAAAAALAFVLWPDSEPAPDVLATGEPSASNREAVPAAPPSPQPSPQPGPPEGTPAEAAEVLDVGLLDDSPLDLGDGDDGEDPAQLAALGDALDVGTAESDAATEAEDHAAQGDALGSSNRRARRKKRQRTGATDQGDPAQPKSAPASAAAPPDAAALLAEARSALSSGNARRAYSLASKSQRAKRSSAALVIMAKAACRFGNESQAKSAFGQLSVSDRRGIRGECRDRGVRLGL